MLVTMPAMSLGEAIDLSRLMLFADTHECLMNPSDHQSQRLSRNFAFRRELFTPTSSCFWP